MLVAKSRTPQLFSRKGMAIVLRSGTFGTGPPTTKKHFQIEADATVDAIMSIARAMYNK